MHLGKVKKNLYKRWEKEKERKKERKKEGAVAQCSGSKYKDEWCQLRSPAHSSHTHR